MSSTKYVHTTMNGDDTVFGVNFADGRIKGYPVEMRGEDKEFFVIFVRGNEEYGQNNFIDNGDGTVTDLATGLMWMHDDYGTADWEEALVYCEELVYAGYDDWRLPDAKELQSIVDYSRSPDRTDSPAIDPVFNCTSIENEKGNEDYAYYWTSTTHGRDSARDGGSNAAYFSFGRAMGNMTGSSEQRGPGGMGNPPPRRN